MLIINTYRQSYQIDSIFDYTTGLGSFWLGVEPPEPTNILVWYKSLKSNDDTIGFSRDGRVDEYKGEVDPEIFEYFRFLSKLIFIRLDELNTITTFTFKGRGIPYNLNDAIHSLLLDKSYIRDYKLSQLC